MNKLFSVVRRFVSKLFFWKKSGPIDYSIKNKEYINDFQLRSKPGRMITYNGNSELREMNRIVLSTILFLHSRKEQFSNYDQYIKYYEDLERVFGQIISDLDTREYIANIELYKELDEHKEKKPVLVMTDILR